jgi:DNA-binding IclR family transcriptional regulator
VISHSTPATDAASRPAAVLRTLADQRWHTSAEIIDETTLLPLAVRLILRDLAGRGLVRRSIDGRWQITPGGAIEAVRHAKGRSG